jgi:hypothetical protein
LLISERLENSKIYVVAFWDSAPCGQYVNCPFGVRYHLHLLEPKISRARNRRVSRRWPRRIVISMILDPECGGDTYLRNVRSHRTSRRYIPEDGNITTAVENLKSYTTAAVGTSQRPMVYLSSHAERFSSWDEVSSRGRVLTTSRCVLAKCALVSTANKAHTV